jgi:hypothetical protein
MRCLLVLLFLVALLVGVGLLVYRRAAAPQVPSAARLADLGTYADQPALSPDGRQVAFISDRDQAGNQDVYVTPLGRGTPTRLTSNPDVSHRS